MILGGKPECRLTDGSLGRYDVSEVSASSREVLCG